ncbi:uncharacterized protein DFL_001657 [Arthrobotrys flagrans]|uniref:Peptidase S8/S53 domain-containing protein n=1 Tax=Arthrobotrys flagrans TaxID=97331 RepID=A0A437A8K1_ARTFL|nr:hypothetical protein DFL_001657 [Arthrobotrys flagrans]
MRHTRNLILFLTLLLLRVSFTAAEDKDEGKGKDKEPDEKPWIFTIRREQRKHQDLGEMHKALEQIDAKPPYNWVFNPADETFGVFFMTVNCTEARKKTIDDKFKHLISASAEYSKAKYRTPLYTAFEAPGYVLDRNINQRQERLMMAQEQDKEVPIRYFYHDSQGEGITVYFIDTGINRNHPEFVEADEEKRLEVIFADPFPPDPNDPAKRKIDVDSSLRFSHGSSVAGVVIGKVTGLAPKAKAVMIAALDRDALSSEALYLSALQKLYSHITTKNAGNRVIVNLSMNAGYFREVSDPKKADPIENDIRDGLSIVFDELAKLENVIITSASGVAEWTEKDAAWSWPNQRAEYFKTSQNLIIVGGVDKEGHGIFQRPKDKFQQVYAPAYAVKIASNIGYQLTTGTSFASAYAAGILANYMSRDKRLTAKAARELLVKNSYPRVKGGPKVIWTGITQDEAGVTAEEMESPLCKRADGEKCTADPSKTRKNPAKIPSKTPSRTPSGTRAPAPQQDDGGYPRPIDESDDDDDDRTDDGDDGGDPESVHYVSTSTVVKEVKYNVYVTVGANGPSVTNKDDLEDVDPLDRKDRDRPRAKARAVAVPTQPRSPVRPDTGNLALKTSTATTNNPLSEPQAN